MATDKMARCGSTDIDLGNTIPDQSPPKKRIAASKKWVFTYNNYPINWRLALRLQDMELYAGWVIGEEVGESGTRHLQGYVEFKNKQRPLECIPLKGVHWEKARGNKEHNIAYCTKDGQWHASGKGFSPRPQVRCLAEADFRPWQARLASTLREVPNDRTVEWYWDTNGGVGKSAFAKWACLRLDALIVSGKASDMKNAIVNWFHSKNYYPEVIIVDVPRTNNSYLSYTGIEEVKNGCFCSPKYEAQMVVMNSPHVVVFSNQEPNYSAMSDDRWNVVCLDEQEG